jgi:MOSC domain-containing protein YiiM
MVSIARIYISPGHNFFGRYGLEAGTHPTHSVPEVECIAGKGLMGDRFFNYKDHYLGQVTFFAWETYANLCGQFRVTDKDPGVFRRNVITRGEDLNALIGKEFEIQGVQFRGTQESSPCEWMDAAFAPGAKKAMEGHGGLRARILTDGVLRVDAP